MPAGSFSQPSWKSPSPFAFNVVTVEKLLAGSGNQSPEFLLAIRDRQESKICAIKPEQIEHANVPYWSEPGGVTPPGGNNGSPEETIPGQQSLITSSEALS